MNAEKVLFKQGDITVTTSRFVVESQTFAIRNITSVRAEKLESGESQGGMWMLFGIGASIAAFAIGTALLGLGAVAAIVYGAYSAWNQKSLYAVVLTTSGGEVKAYSSEDEGQIKGIVKGLNDAIVALA